MRYKRKLRLCNISLAVEFQLAGLQLLRIRVRNASSHERRSVVVWNPMVCDLHTMRRSINRSRRRGFQKMSLSKLLYSFASTQSHARSMLFWLASKSREVGFEEDDEEGTLITHSRILFFRPFFATFAFGQDIRLTNATAS